MRPISCNRLPKGSGHTMRAHRQMAYILSSINPLSTCLTLSPIQRTLSSHVFGFLVVNFIQKCILFLLIELNSNKKSFQM